MSGQTNSINGKNYNYTINIPSSFSETESSGKNIDLKYKDDKGCAIIVNVSPRQAEEYNYSVHDYTKEVLEEGIKPTNPTFNILKTEKTFISGEKAYLITFSASAFDIKSMECYIFHKDKAFVITCSSSISNFSQYETTFRTVIKSLKLIK